jgi:hypothetical protein
MLRSLLPDDADVAGPRGLPGPAGRHHPGSAGLQAALLLGENTVEREFLGARSGRLDSC